MPKCETATCGNLVTAGFCPTCERMRAAQGLRPSGGTRTAAKCIEEGCGSMALWGGRFCGVCERKREARRG